MADQKTKTLGTPDPEPKPTSPVLARPASRYSGVAAPVLARPAARYSGVAAMLAYHGDPWMIHSPAIRAYADSFGVWMPDPGECEARTGPTILEAHPADGSAGECLGLREAVTIAGTVDGTEIQAVATSARTKKAIAVLPLSGPITLQSSPFSAMFGGTSTEKWGRVFGSLVANDDVGAIVIRVDSPGGSVFGVQELVAQIFAARGNKPIIAVADAKMFSAAYWIGSAADEIVVVPSGQTGSIGVVMLHVDESQLLEMEGIVPTFIFAGEKKVWANPFEPLTPESTEMLQGIADTYYDSFTAAVAKHRGTTAKVVKAGFGQGGIVMAKESVVQGLADRVDTLDGVLRRLGGAAARTEQVRADRAARVKAIQRAEAECKAYDPPRPLPPPPSQPEPGKPKEKSETGVDAPEADD